MVWYNIFFFNEIVFGYGYLKFLVVFDILGVIYVNCYNNVEIKKKWYFELLFFFLCKIFLVVDIYSS